MAGSSQKFPHIQLKLTTQGRAVSTGGGAKKNAFTIANLNNRQAHGSKLKNSVESLIFNWQKTQEEREEGGKPPLKSQRIILQIDPNCFNPEGLKAYGIELIADTEDGFIISASADLELSELQKKIEKFIKEQHGGNTVAQIWEIIDGKKKPELILSPSLYTELYPSSVTLRNK
ncbi:Serine protease, subtilisin family [Nostoc flagelliforme CCNUN1]|uniref:Serine protease, subtilisin family n=2 Tax=Nostoc flagelliforme TaxID=1306274 RepID=A0A2K8T2R6_9NOSO|nr:Serine protease, subtilisin family [Nostoc flagelliforme CCNUN1]